MMRFHMHHSVKFNRLLPQRQDVWVMLIGACLALGALLHHVVLIYVLPWGTPEQYAFGQTQWVFFVSLAILLVWTLWQPARSYGVRPAAFVLLLAQLLTLVVIVLEVQGPDNVAFGGMLNFALFVLIHLCSVFGLTPLVPWRTLPRLQTWRLAAETSLVIAFVHTLLHVALPLTNSAWLWTPMLIASQIRLATSLGLCFLYVEAYRRWGEATRRVVVLGVIGLVCMLLNDVLLLWAMVEVAAGASGRWIRATTVVWMLQHIAWVLALYWAARTPMLWQDQTHNARLWARLRTWLTPTRQGQVLIVLVVLGSSISASLWNTMWLVAALISREALLAQERDRAQQAERAMEERTRIARELHDGVWRWLNLAYVQLVICERCLERDPQHALEEIKVAKHYVAESQQEARQTMYTLRAEAQFDQPLPDLLRPAIDELQATGIDVHCDVLGPSRILDARTHAALIRVVQEGLTNVRRHAQATEVVITIEYCRAKRVHLRICDNGIGMPELVPGLGLTGMHERIAELQGDFTIETSCGQGVCIHVEVPG